MYTTRVSWHIRAPRAAVYAALVDPQAVAAWRVPDGMTAVVHEFNARPGGTFRVSLRYAAGAGNAKSAADTDTYRGRFVELVPDERVVEELAFETPDAAMGGAMRIATTLVDADGGTDILIVHDGVPDAVSPADNETGTRMALANLARLVEGTRPPAPSA